MKIATLVSFSALALSACSDPAQPAAPPPIDGYAGNKISVTTRDDLVFDENDSLSQDAFTPEELERIRRVRDLNDVGPAPR